jgi:hypothetical protein
LVGDDLDVVDPFEHYRVPLSLAEIHRGRS